MPPPLPPFLNHFASFSSLHCESSSVHHTHTAYRSVISPPLPHSPQKCTPEWKVRVWRAQKKRQQRRVKYGWDCPVKVWIIWAPIPDVVETREGGREGETWQPKESETYFLMQPTHTVICWRKWGGQWKHRHRAGKSKTEKWGNRSPKTSNTVGQDTDPNNCSWCAGRHLAWQPLPSVYETMYESL